MTLDLENINIYDIKEIRTEKTGSLEEYGAVGGGVRAKDWCTWWTFSF